MHGAQAFLLYHYSVAAEWWTPAPDLPWLTELAELLFCLGNVREFYLVSEEFRDYHNTLYTGHIAGSLVTLFFNIVLNIVYSFFSCSMPTMYMSRSFLFLKRLKYFIYSLNIEHSM